MADISLDFSSKAPPAGTFTAFADVIGTWRQRAASAANSPSPCAFAARPRPQRRQLQFEASKPSGEADVFTSSLTLGRAAVMTLQGPIPSGPWPAIDSSASLSIAGFFFASRHLLERCYLINSIMEPFFFLFMGQCLYFN